MYLIDTNIFLEILLEQEKSNECKDFLDKNIDSLNISDFTLHSIGVILFRQKEDQSFLRFISDTLIRVNLLSLPINKYKEVVIIKNNLGLGFDDSYQYSICRQFNLTLVTMDKDFKRVKDVEIQFL
jgi:predicted nucleic acid-binding protein